VAATAISAAAHAPNPHVAYRFVNAKTTDTNPGMTVTDPSGRKWSVKQASHDPARGDEGPVEVTLSRVLSGLARYARIE
jgi:hypothetical protein